MRREGKWAKLPVRGTRANKLWSRSRVLGSVIGIGLCLGVAACSSSSKAATTKLGGTGVTPGGGVTYQIGSGTLGGHSTTCDLPTFTTPDTAVTPPGTTPAEALSNFLIGGSLQDNGMRVQVAWTGYPRQHWTLRTLTASSAVYQAGTAHVDLSRDGPNSWVVASGSGGSDSC